MKKRLPFALILLLLFSTYNIQDTLSLNKYFRIKEVIIENNIIVEEKKIKENLSFLFKTNLFFLKNSSIQKQLNQFDFIKSYEIKKIYPNKIKLKIFEKTPIAIIQNKKKKNFYTKNGDMIGFFKIDKFKDLPIVFGDKDNFDTFYKALKSINFPLYQVKRFYFFESKRWDLITYNNQTIKLPVENYDQSLINFLKIKDKHNFKKYQIFDYRIKNQLILK